MKSPTKLLLVALALIAGSTAAWAHGHARIGVYFGPNWGSWWYPPPAYYYPPVVVERSSPIYADQQPLVVEAAPASNYWYFCREANTYYPYVRQCPGGWEKVPAKPAGQ
jgi:hypothetical protein